MEIECMTQKRVLGSFLTDPHYWLVEAMEDGKVWFTIGETKYLFSCDQVAKLCLKLLKLTVNRSDRLDPVPEPIGGPDMDVSILIQTSEDPLDQLRKDAA